MSSWLQVWMGVVVLWVALLVQPLYAQGAPEPPTPAPEAKPTPVQSAGAEVEAGRVYKTVVLTVLSELADRDLAQQITRVLRVETQRNKAYDLMDSRDLSLTDSLGAFGCVEPTPDCMRELAGSLDAERIIFSNLQPVDGLLDISVNIYDQDKNRVVGQWNRRFSRDVDAIGFFAREMGAFLGGREPASTTVLRISCNVQGANVIVDGRRVGRTPYQGENFTAGRHDIVVAREGYSSWRRNVDLVEGEGRLYSVTLRPLDEGAQVPPPGVSQSDDASAGPLRTYGWVLLSTGAVVMATGGVFGVLAGQTHDDFLATQQEREAVELRDQGLGQASTANVLYTIGGLSALTGATLLILSLLEEPEQAPGLGLTPLPSGGAAVQWQMAW